MGGKSIKIPIINSSPIAGVNPASLNVRETYSVERSSTCSISTRQAALPALIDVKGLAAGDESSEPKTFNTTFTVPAEDSGEPDPVT